MRIVVALGGNALLRRGEPMTAEAQRANVQIAAAALAAIQPGNELVITHGNGPQVGLLAGEAQRLKAEKGWTMKQDGDKWRRVVASPQPKRIFEIRPIKWLLEKGTIVIAAGGGGIPTVYEPGRLLRGIEAVIDKDLCSELLARELDADFFIMATDADAVYIDWGKPNQRAIRSANPDALRSHAFPAGSMGPKVDAACHFAEATGKKAAIGALKDLKSILQGEAGTTISTASSGILWSQ